MNLDLILKVNEGRGINKGIMIYTIYMNACLSCKFVILSHFDKHFYQPWQDAEDGIFN